MLLSIDRVLQLLSDGKTVSKIAELAKCDESNVIEVIKEARNILNSQDRQVTRKKIIFKKKNDNDISADNEAREKKINKMFKGSELSTVPVESSLVMYVDGTSHGSPGPSGIGILIYDRGNRQVGKLSYYIGKMTVIEAIYNGILRALEIAEFFQTKELKLRINSETVIKELNGEIKIDKSSIKKMHTEIVLLKKNIKNCKIEHVTGNLHEKAKYLSNLGADKKNFA